MSTATRFLNVSSLTARGFLILAAVLLVVGPKTAHGQIDLFTGGQEVTASFDDFRGNGFAPAPDADQLNSTQFIVTGLSDGDLSFGDTADTGDFARGADAGGVFSGGIYAFETSTGDFSLGVQPTGSDFTPGSVLTQYRNETGAPLSAVALAYEVKVFNDEDRASSFEPAYASGSCGNSPMEADFADLPTLAFTSPATADDDPSWDTVSRSITVSSVQVLEGECLFVRFTSDDEGGSGGRDELALDNLSVTPNPPTVQFTAGSGTVTESEQTTGLTVELSNPDGQLVEVDVAFKSDGSTAEPADFTSTFPATTTSTTVSFPSSAADGETRTVPLGLETDGETEGEETAQIRLESLSTEGDATLATPSAFGLTIQDAVSDHGGDVLITELMPAPSVSDSDGEYIELFNATDSAISLEGWTVVPPGSGDTNIEEPLEIPPRDFLVLCRSVTPSANGGIQNCDLKQTGALTNSGGAVVVRDEAGSVVDSVNYDSAAPWPDFDDAAIVFTGTTENNLGSNWTTAPRRERGFALGETGSEDSGSPGRNGAAQTLQPSQDITGAAGWRMLSAPMSDVNADTLAQSNLVQGIEGHFPNAEPNLFQWPGGPDGVTDWTKPSSATADLTGSAASSGAGSGFIWFIFDSAETEYTDPPPFTLGLPGTPRTSDQTTASLGEGFHLLGNPYAQSFDLSSLNLNEQGFQTTAQVWDPNAGSYRALTQSIGADDQISPYQGFFVERTAAGSAALTFDASGRRADPVELLNVEEGLPRIDFRLVGLDENGSILTRDDALRLHAPEGASVGWDVHDASKLIPLSTRYVTAAFEGSLDGTKRLQSVASVPFPLPNEDIELPISVQVQNADSLDALRLEWPDWDDVPDHWGLGLLDTEVDTLVNLRDQSSYTFSLSSGADQPQTSVSPVSGSPASLQLPSRLYAGAPSNRLNTEQSSDSTRLVLLVQSAPLPVELSAFEAVVSDQSAVLTWRTVSETNNAGFDVQHRGPQADQFVPLTFVTSKASGGTTDAPRRYRYRTSALRAGAHAFRLRQVDLDGSEAFSDTATVSVPFRKEAEVQVFPNPLRGEATVTLRVRRGQDVSVRLYDLLGREVRVLRDGPMPADKATALILEADALSSGTYFLHVEGEQFTETRRLTVVR